jgi:hypothetical protein
MRGRDFLSPARDDAAKGTEAHWRAAIVSAYYALMLECRDTLKRWGRAVPPKHAVHAAVRLCLTFAKEPDVKTLGYDLDDLGSWRNKAHYDLSPRREFSSSTFALTIIQRSSAAIAQLDAIEADPARRAKAIVSLPP